MYTYEFGMKLSFSVYDGPVSIKVNNGLLELDEKPDQATAQLIEKCGGKLMLTPQPESEPAAKKAAAKKGAN